MGRGYDGSWHYVAKNYARPVAVISRQGLTKYNTPNDRRLNPEKHHDDMGAWWWIDNEADLLSHTKRKSVEYEERLKQYYGND